MVQAVKELIESQMGDGFAVTINKDSVHYIDVIKAEEAMDDFYSYDIRDNGVKIYKWLENIELSEEDCTLEFDGDEAKKLYRSATNNLTVMGVIVDGLMVYANEFGTKVDMFDTYKDQQSTFEQFIDENERLPLNVGEFVCYLMESFMPSMSEYYRDNFATFEEAKKYAEEIIKDFKEQ